jgi:hypothetical protein
VKVYLDEDVSPIVARLLRDKGVDAVSAHEVGRVQLDERPQLAEATGAGRAIITANVVDFLALAHDAVAGNVEHAGIVLVPSSFRGDEFDAMANAVVRVASQYEGSRRARRLSPAKPVAEFAWVGSALFRIAHFRMY